jgi:precorrin-6B methylase 2
MYIDYSDPVQWLSHRFASDAAARNPEIEKKCLDYFRERPVLRIVDVGSGTASNFCYYFDKFSQSQHWTLLERDQALIGAARKNLMHFCQKHVYELKTTEEGFIIKANGKSAEIVFCRAKLQQIEKCVDMKKTDLLTANAVFDLISFDHFEELVIKLSAYNTCLLATLNYYETSFLPYREEDGRFVNYYHTHMLRPQADGIAMGPNCCEEMLDLLSRHQMMIEQDSSQWRLKKYDTTMHHYILHFFENALRELNLSPHEQEEVDEWIRSKRHLSDKHRLEITVDHSDIFAYP